VQLNSHRFKHKVARHRLSTACHPFSSKLAVFVHFTQYLSPQLGWVDYKTSPVRSFCVLSALPRRQFSTDFNQIWSRGSDHQVQRKSLLMSYGRQDIKFQFYAVIFDFAAIELLCSTSERCVFRLSSLSKNWQTAFRKSKILSLHDIRFCRNLT
jgi:hypothetical protein